MAAAEAGDERMDTMALAAACSVISDRKLALETVTPILDRGVGIGWQHNRTYTKTSATIRSYLEGTIDRSALGGYFTYPPGFSHTQ